MGLPVYVDIRTWPPGIAIHLSVQFPVVTCHLFDFMLLRDEWDSEDVRVVK